MRGKMAAGVLVALALVIPAAPALAEPAAPPGLDAACQPIERKVYKDIRELVSIDPDTAPKVEVEIVATRVLSAAQRDKLLALPEAAQKALDGTEEQQRTFLKTGVRQAFLVDLRILTLRTLTDDRTTNANKAAQKALDAGSIEALLAFMNDGLYAARALDCATKPTTPPVVSPTPTPTRSASAPAGASQPGDTGGEGGGLPVTGAAAGIVAAVGGALLLLGGAGFLIGRRRRSRFVA